jgi:hypothetical protein
LALINNGVIQINTKVWKMKIPLKIKIFMWYIQKGVVLTKDNLAKRNWNGRKQCSFCMNNESIQHLFFKCYYVRFLWGLAHITFGIPPPRNRAHMFGSWTSGTGWGGGRVLKRQLLAGASVFCWTIWLSRNDVVFDKTPIKSFL